MSELEIFELECGIVLELQGINEMLFLDLIEGIKPDKNGQYSVDSVKKIPIRNLNRMMRVICGWGIINDVPPDEADDYAMFGDGKRLQRSAWARDIATTEELSEVLARVMALTKGASSNSEKSPEQLEIERLQAENKRLKGQSELGQTKETADGLAAIIREQGGPDAVIEQLKAQKEDGD